MKKNFVEAEIEVTLLTALEDVMFKSPDREDLGDVENGWDEG